MKDLTIKMLSDAVDINEVVVVGYGVQKKVNLTGSVSSVKGDVLERRPVADAVQSLQGMVPGLLVKQFRWWPSGWSRYFDITRTR